MSHNIGEDEKAHYYLKDVLGRDPTREERDRFVAEFKWVETPVLRSPWKSEVIDEKRWREQSATVPPVAR